MCVEIQTYYQGCGREKSKFHRCWRGIFLIPLIAARARQWEAAKFLLQQKANPNERDHYGSSFLHYATSIGGKDVLQWALNEFPSIEIHTRDSMGQTPLCYAAYFVNKEAFDLLIRHGAKVVDQDPIPFLAIAPAESNIRELLKHDLDWGISMPRDFYNGWSAKNNGVELDNASCFHIAILDFLHDSMFLLLNNQLVNVNHSTSTGMMPLHLAILVNNDPGLEMLLEHGADAFKIVSVTGDNALHIAVSWKRLHMIDLLIKHGCDPNHKNHRGFTPIDIAEICEDRYMADIIRKFAIAKSAEDEEDKNAGDETQESTNGVTEDIKAISIPIRSASAAF